MNRDSESRVPAIRQAREALAQGDVNGAISILGKATEATPNNSQLLYEYARTLVRSGHHGGAIPVLIHSLGVPPLLRASVELLSTVLRDHDITMAEGRIPEEIALAFGEDVSHQPFSRAALGILGKHEPLSTAYTIGRDKGWPVAAKLFLSSNEFADLRQMPMFLLSLSNGVNVDFDLEFLLTAVRRLLCFQQEGGDVTDKSNHPFLSSLIQQCHNNEFVFFVSEEEKNIIEDIKVDSSEVAAGNLDAVRKMCLLALYKPIHSFFEFDQVAKKLRYQKNIPKDLRTWIGERSKTRRLEKKMLERIEEFSPITDVTSQSVAQQYEQNPYPLWSTMTRPKNGSANNHLKPFFSPREREFIDHPFKVLIAGCGTGRQVIEWSIEFGANAEITALDLSKASLAYAAMKANQYDFDTIRFVRGDILDLDGFDQVFDIVIVTGVIHHMADPLNGWRILVDRLRPGGLILVSLYSAIARRSWHHLGQNPDYRAAQEKDQYIRKVRYDLMIETPPGERLEKGMAYVDFFSMSDVRDLMFHESEKHFTLPEIKRCLEDLRLEFRGFDCLHNSIHREFKGSYGDPADLDNWEHFEETNPDTFAGMYEFWCIKPPG